MQDAKDIDLSEDLFETAAKQLREDIDWEVYSDLLVTNFNRSEEHTSELQSH